MRVLSRNEQQSVGAGYVAPIVIAAIGFVVARDMKYTTPTQIAAGTICGLAQLALGTENLLKTCMWGATLLWSVGYF